MSEVVLACMAMAGICVAGILASRRQNPGYFDLLTPICALYFFHGVTRAVVIVTEPRWAEIHPIVATTSLADTSDAVWLMAGSLAAMAVGYLLGFGFRARRWDPRPWRPDQTIFPQTILLVGLFFRLVLVFSGRIGVNLPSWALTPTETLGWLALAGLFLMAHAWAADRNRHVVTAGAQLAVALVCSVYLAPNVGWSREAFLQPILAALVGAFVGRRRAPWQMAVGAVAITAVVMVLGFGVKRQMAYDTGIEGDTRIQMIERESATYDSPFDYALAALQNRLHVLDSLIICRYYVPLRRPYEEGSIWLRIATSAFVPRAFLPKKDVGWAAKFAREFWGTESAGIGIGHIGHFYIFGGVQGCIVGMLILGAGLGLLAGQLHRRGDVRALALLLLMGITMMQLERDLEVVVGGSLKLLALAVAGNWIAGMRLARKERTRIARGTKMQSA